VSGGGLGEVTERKVATHGFPYAVRYRVSDGQLVVMAVYHQHRDPGFGVDRRP
jgi:plasmid stabilization system protein ParE